ncbi:MAG TPA: ABC transporter permease [Bryobacteraceae bacterium]|nr:ABC transporter permease [Bryobacteraceae bacterium]
MRLLAEFVQDARCAVRSMRHTPGFTVVAVLTLALGIGANTAIFSVLYGVWLSPARYARAERLVDASRQQLTGRRFLSGTSYSDLADWRAQTRTIENFGLHQYAHQVNISGEQGAEEVIGHRVSANLFGLLGAHPALGHPLDAEADRGAGPRQALISYVWWRRRFGGDARVIGKEIQVNDEAFTIAGVMPQAFEFPPMGSAEYRPVIWMSLNVPAEQESSRAFHPLAVVARLKPGASIQQAQAEMNTIAFRLASAYPQEDGGWGIKITRLNDVRQLDEARPALLLVMAAASLVLLVACANIANLLLARAFGREREMAVRRALGATWQRLARQVLTESGVLALSGGAAGVLLAYGATPFLKAVLPAAMPRADEIEVSGTVLWFAAGISLLTGLLFGGIPALRTGSGAGRGLGGRSVAARNRVARVLVTVEVALALVLLAGAGLLIESFRRVANVDLGFRKEHALTMRLQLTKKRYPDGTRVAAFRAELLRRVQGLPGVQYAGTVSSLPMGIVMQGTEFEIEGRPETARNKPFVDYANVSRDYLRAMGIPLVRGRYFDAGDRPGSPPVALVSDSVARAHWPDGAALGSRIRFDNTWFTITGIVKDVQQYSPEHGARGGTIYALNEQLPAETQGNVMGRLMVLVTRTASEPGSVAAAMRRAVAEIDKDQPVADVSTLKQLVWRTLAARRLNTLLLGLFAGLAIVLAAVGVFGVTSYAVARRTKEIGIRMAMGATPTSVLAMVTRETLLLAVMGAAIGIGGTAATSRLLARFLYGVKPAEPVIVTGVAMVLVAIVVVSGIFPARRAMRVDPVVALRED